MAATNQTRQLWPGRRSTAGIVFVQTVFGRSSMLPASCSFRTVSCFGNGQLSAGNTQMLVRQCLMVVSCYPGDGGSGWFVVKVGLPGVSRPSPGQGQISPNSLEHRRGSLFEANLGIYEGWWPKKASNGGSLKKGMFEGRFWHPLRVKTPNLEPSNALGYIILGPFTA